MSSPFRSRALAWIRLFLFIVLIGGGLLASRNLPFLGMGGRDKGRIQVNLDKVVDGDTAWFTDRSGERIKVRFIGIDAPESGGSEFFRSGLLAATLLEDAREIVLEPDPGKPQDKHGRMLAWVWLSMPDGRELLLQEEMLRAGEAQLYRDASGSLHYNRIEKSARR